MVNEEDIRASALLLKTHAKRREWSARGDELLDERLCPCFETRSLATHYPVV